VVGAVVLVVVVALRRAPAAEPESDDAATAAVRGDLAGARALLVPRLAKNPREPRALFVLSSVCLEQGDLVGAKDAADRFVAAAPSAPEGPVLLALIESRARPQAESWSASFIEAVRKAGLQVAPPVIGALSTRVEEDRAAIAKLELADRLLVRVALFDASSADDRQRDALELAKVEDLSLAVGLTAYSVLRSPPLAHDSERARAAADVLQRLAKRFPDVNFLCAVALLEGTSSATPLTSEQTVLLGKAIDASARNPLPELYEAFKAAVAKVDPGAAHEAAFGATMAPYPATIPSGLRKYTSATKLDLADLQARLGRRLIAEPTILDLNLGRAFLARSAELSGDASVAAEAELAAESFRGLHGELLLRFSAGWPLASLQRELRDRQIVGERELVREAALPP
jgi:hypothetical protein